MLSNPLSIQWVTNHSVLLAPLPFQEADRLFLLWARNSETEDAAGPLSPADTAVLLAALAAVRRVLRLDPAITLRR